MREHPSARHDAGRRPGRRDRHRLRRPAARRRRRRRSCASSRRRGLRSRRHRWSPDARVGDGEVGGPLFRYLDAGKRSVARPGDRGRSMPPTSSSATTVTGPASPSSRPQAIVVSYTPFGLDGPCCGAPVVAARRRRRSPDRSPGAATRTDVRCRPEATSPTGSPARRQLPRRSPPGAAAPAP